jgi:plastocyanin
MALNFRVGRIFVLVVGVAVWLAFAGGASAGEKAAGQEITIDNFSFGPTTVSVPTGTTVTWVNHDDIPHTVVSEDLITFKSRPLDTDDRFSFKFEKAGTYKYFCSIHPKMTAQVVVR